MKDLVTVIEIDVGADAKKKKGLAKRGLSFIDSCSKLDVVNIKEIRSHCPLIITQKKIIQLFGLRLMNYQKLL